MAKVGTSNQDRTISLKAAVRSHTKKQKRTLCRSCVALLIEVFPVAVEGIRLSRTPGDPSVLCLREEREHGSQLFTIPEP